jgi:hypothetical protein
MCLLLWFCLLWSCSDKVPQKEEDKNILQVMSEDNIEDFDKYYKPAEFEGMDMLRSDAKWSWFRSKQSEHFFVFWEAGFGDDPNAETVPANLRVDIDDLLEKAELFYRTNVEKLKFAGTVSALGSSPKPASQNTKKCSLCLERNHDHLASLRSISIPSNSAGL